MNKLIATAALALALAGCSASPPQAPLVATPDPGSCAARNDRTPCTLTNQEALIEILRLSQTNVLIQCYKPAASWQDMLLPPVKTGECK